MKTITLPKPYLNSEKIILGFGDLQVESTVTFTIFGEVVEINSDFLKLPEAAQKLICGEHAVNIKRRTQNYLALLDHFLPMIALDLLNHCFYGNLPNQFRVFKESLGINLPTIKAAKFQNKWTQAVYDLYESDKESEVLKHLRILLDSGQPKKRKALFKELPLHDQPSPLLEPVVKKLLLVLHDKQEINDAIKSLILFPNEDTYEMLISRLGKNNYRYDAAILYSLSIYQKKALEKQLIDYYNEQVKGRKDRQYKIKEELLRCLANFPSKTMENIIIYELGGNAFPPASEAFDTFIRLGKSEEEIVYHIRNNWAQKVTIGHINVALKLYAKVKNLNFLPNADEVLKLLIWSYSKYDRHEGTALNVGRLLIRVANENTYKTLADFLTNRNENLKYASLLVYGIIGRKKDKPQIELIAKNTEDPLWLRASHTLLKIERRIESNEYFEKLLVQLSKTKSATDKSKILNLIKSFINANPHPKNIKPVLLAELTSAYHYNQLDIKLLLLELLGAVPDQEVAEVLDNLSQEPHSWPIVQTAEMSYQKIMQVLKNENK